MVTASQPTCPNCGAQVSFVPGHTIAKCPYCQTDVALQPPVAKPQPQWSAGPPPGVPGPGWGGHGPGWAPPPVNPAAYHQVHLQMAAQQAQHAGHAMKWVIWIIVLTTVVPLVLTFFFVFLGMCAAFGTAAR